MLCPSKQTLVMVHDILIIESLSDNSYNRSSDIFSDIYPSVRKMEKSRLMTWFYSFGVDWMET